MVNPAMSSGKFLVVVRYIQFLQALGKTASSVVNVVLVSISTIDETEAETLQSLMVLFDHAEWVKGKPPGPCILVYLAGFEING